MSWMIDAAIVCGMLALAINVSLLWKDAKAYRAKKREIERDKTVYVRADDLAAVIAAFVGK